MSTKQLEKNPNFRAPLIKLAFGDEADGAPIATQVEIIRCGSFSHPQYGDLEITPKILKSFIVNFQDKVRRIDIAIDYAHDNGNIAAAWFQELILSENGKTLFAKVKWTPKGTKVLADREFRYLSAEFNLEYTDNETSKNYGPTLLGAGLTNRPFVKGMEPVIPLSEGKVVDPNMLDPKELHNTIQGHQARLDKLEAAVSKMPAPAAKGKKAAAAPADQDKEQDADEASMTDGMKKKYADLQKELADANAKIAKMGAGAAGAPGTSAGDSGDEGGDDEDSEDGDADSEDDSDSGDEEDSNNGDDGVKDKNKKVAASEKEKEFDKLLSEGTVVAAQKEFDKLLSEGTVVAAQKEAYLAGDMIKFAALQVKPHTKRKSSEQEGANTLDSETDAQDRLIALAEGVAKEKTISLNDALSFVLADPKNKTLRAAYEKKSYNNGFGESEEE